MDFTPTKNVATVEATIRFEWSHWRSHHPQKGVIKKENKNKIICSGLDCRKRKWIFSQSHHPQLEKQKNKKKFSGRDYLNNLKK